MERSIRILLADDHTIVRQGLARLLKDQPGFEIVGEAINGRMAIEKALTLKPDVVVMDIAMPILNGIEAAINIRGFLPFCKVLLFSGQAATAGLLDEARRHGYEFEILSKPVHPQDLVAKLRQ